MPFVHPNGHIIYETPFGRASVVIKEFEKGATEMTKVAEKTKEAVEDLTEKAKDEKPEPAPDACKTHQKKPGRFWSSCPSCHKIRMKYEKRLRSEGKHVEDRNHSVRNDVLEEAEVAA